MNATISGIVSDARGSYVRSAQPEPIGVLDEPRGRPFGEIAARHLARGRLDVDLVVDVGDVVDERDVVAGCAFSQLRSHIASTNGRALPTWTRW